MATELAEHGLVLEAFGDGASSVREVQALLSGLDIKGMVRDLADGAGLMGRRTGAEGADTRRLRHLSLPFECARRQPAVAGRG